MFRMLIASSLLWSVAGLPMDGTCAAAPDEPQRISYSRQAAPLLQKYCSGCHNATDHENELALHSAAAIQRGSKNGAVISDQDPKNSRLLTVLLSTGDDHMPPADEAQLKPEELRILAAWIEAGAVFDGAASAMLDVPSVPVTAENVVNPVLGLAVSRDTHQIALGRFRSVELSSGTQNVLVRAIPVDDGKVTDVEYSPDGSYLLAATGVAGLSGRAISIDVQSAMPVREYAGHHDILYCATQSADGHFVATAGYDRRILLHDAKSAEILRELTGHNGAVFDLAFSPDATLLASASADGTIKVWRVADGERLDTMSQPLSEQYCVLFSPDGRFVLAAGADNRIRRWEVRSRTSARINPLVDSRFAHEGAIQNLVMSADGKLLASSAEDGTLKIWNADSLRELSSRQLAPELVTALAFSEATSELVAATSGGRLLRVPLPTAGADSAPNLKMVSPVPVETAAEIASAEVKEQEPNDLITAAQVVQVPVTISGGITAANDTDTYRFAAIAGQQFFMDVKAARLKSPMDSRIEVLDASGKQVLQTKLQAVRDSYFTFRGKDSETSDDFRLFNWQEMDLNQYLYADGEVVRLWLYPRGPDSGFKVYPGFGQRYTYFGTTPMSHALQAPTFIVVPRAPEEEFPENGLPVFPVYYENDDDSRREWGTDSRLIFQAPADGDYIVRVTDARGLAGDDFLYQLTVRAPRPDFGVTMAGQKVSVHPETGRELSFTAVRIDGYDGPIELVAENLPPGFTASLPTGIEQDQQQAFVTLFASADAVQPDNESVSRIRFLAKGLINGQEVIHEIGGLTELKLAEKPKVRLTIHAADQFESGNTEHTPELTVYAGETTRAFVRATRTEFQGNVEMGKEDSGRNMPHGVFVDNIGLNGLMILQDQTEREFFITVAKWVPETSRPFYLKSNIDGITSLPVLLHIRHRSATSDSTAAAR